MQYGPIGFYTIRDRVILVVRECIWNALVVLLGLSTFDNTGSLGYPTLWMVVYHPLVSTPLTAARFLAKEWED